MKTGKTRQALLISGVSLLASVALLAGTTFAWFTDSVTNSGNKIQAGTLDIVFNDDTDDDTETLFSTDGTTLWEPGRSQKAAADIRNEGSLWLKYRFEVSNVLAAGSEAYPDADITEVLDVYLVSKAEAEVTAADLIQDTYLGTIADLVNNEESTLKGDGILAPKGQSGEVDGVTYDAADTFTLVIKMQEKAGNEYQGASVRFDLNLKATQFTYEKDGFGNDKYDEDAPVIPWDGETVDTAWYSEEADAFTLATSEALAGLSQLVGEGTSFAGKTIRLSRDIDLGGKEWTPIGSADTLFQGTFDGNGHTVSGISMNREWVRTESGLFGAVKDAAIRNLTTEGSIQVLSTIDPGGTAQYTGGVGGICGSAGGSTTISGCTNRVDIDATEVKIGNWNYWNVGVGGILGFGMLNDGSASNVTILDCLNEGDITAEVRNGDPQTAPFIAGITMGTDCESIQAYRVVNVGQITLLGDIDAYYTQLGLTTCGGIVALSNCNDRVNHHELIDYRWVFYPEKHLADAVKGWYSATIRLAGIDVCSTADGEPAPYNVITSAEDMAKQETFAGFDFENVWELTNGQYPTLRK